MDSELGFRGDGECYRSLIGKLGPIIYNQTCYSVSEDAAVPGNDAVSWAIAGLNLLPVA